jgi:prepilin-type N-terminal cleavage/methylation domain-containing protein
MVYGVKQSEAGFTLIELLIAMAIFGMSLTIIIGGIINVMNLHNQAMAANYSQDNARHAIDAVVQAVRDSSGSTAPVIGVDASGADLDTLCLDVASGPKQFFAVVGGVLQRSNGCTSPTGTVDVTGAGLFGAKLVLFKVKPMIATTPPGQKSELEIKVTFANDNNTSTTNLATHTTQCGTSVAQRSFCSVVTLTAGATPR